MIIAILDKMIAYIIMACNITQGYSFKECSSNQVKASNCHNCGANSHKNGKCAYCGTVGGLIMENTTITNEERELIKKAFTTSYSLFK